MVIVLQEPRANFPADPMFLQTDITENSQKYSFGIWAGHDKKLDFLLKWAWTTIQVLR